MGQHEGLPVSGYRPQSAEAVAKVNTSKSMEECVLRLLDQLAADPEGMRTSVADPKKHARSPVAAYPA